MEFYLRAKRVEPEDSDAASVTNAKRGDAAGEKGF